MCYDQQAFLKQLNKLVYIRNSARKQEDLCRQSSLFTNKAYQSKQENVEGKWLLLFTVLHVSTPKQHI